MQRTLAPFAVLCACLLVLTGCAGSSPVSSDASSASASSSSSSDDLKPFSKVVPDDAETNEGLLTTHFNEEDLFLSIPDSVLGREILTISRASQAPDGLAYGGEKVNTQVLRWQRRGDKVLLRVVSYENIADEDDPVYRAVQNSNFEPIVQAFDVKALTEDSTGVVIEATDLFASDVPALGLPQQARKQYKVRRLDTDRSFITGVKSFPENTDVETVLTYQAQEPPSNESTGTLSVAMNHSFVLLPKQPMQARLCDDRVGYFSVERTDYSSDKQKAAEECVITRWRLEPSDPEAYADGEVVEPVEPIVYYIDPATPEKWRPYLKQGVEDWQVAFERAGFKNAIIAKDPPTAEEDPDFDPDDVRYSTIRYFASDIPNAYGPHVHDPRSGEILESDIGWYHNVMNLLRNWYFVQTAAINPSARGPVFDDEVMGELIRFVSAHEVGHTIGLPHNWGSSYAVPVDSLRSPSYTSEHGTAPSIMDYARFNYVAQPGDGVTQFGPRVGEYDKWAVNFGYRDLGIDDKKADAQVWDDRIREKAGDPVYFYGRQTLTKVDPRSQNEDLTNDAVEASRLGIANLKRILPNLIEWTREDGADYATLEELYGAVLNQWGRYMGHVGSYVGGIYDTPKTYTQDGVVFEPVPANRQREAMAFLVEEGLQTPTWMLETDILRRIEHAGAVDRIRDAQMNVVEMMLEPRRMARLIESEALANGEETYTLNAMLTDLRDGVWAETDAGDDVGPFRRNLQRGYLEEMADLMTETVDNPDIPDAFADYVQFTPVTVEQSDIRAAVRGQLTALQDDVQRALRGRNDMATEQHYEDVLVRIDNILNPDSAD
ncbi:zinc-dependent metalloprotease [Longibacter salinarum]|uniref:Zinc-dependent metalloprotease n=1 Tax=Longibacter salinarum TaxID=1850348 RepID=A0A2A8CXW8_9BACT|nr:zinc-dependent metalloprotease [Longibacter salinarum]PEN13461.1 zinc-dependent metalloprotease [Longibacter salinarum]